MAGEWIFYGGLMIAAISFAAGLLAAGVLWLWWRGLSQKLDKAYGEKKNAAPRKKRG